MARMKITPELSGVKECDRALKRERATGLDRSRDGPDLPPTFIELGSEKMQIPRWQRIAIVAPSMR